MGSREVRAYASLAVREIGLAAGEIAEALAAEDRDLMLSRLREAKKTIAAVADKVARAEFLMEQAP